MPFNNKLYTEGAAGLIDFVWLWYNRISLVVFVAAFIVLLIANIAGYNAKVDDNSVQYYGRRPEYFIRGTNFKNLSRDRQQIKRII